MTDCLLEAVFVLATVVAFAALAAGVARILVDLAKAEGCVDLFRVDVGFGVLLAELLVGLACKIGAMGLTSLILVGACFLVGFSGDIGSTLGRILPTSSSASSKASMASIGSLVGDIAMVGDVSNEVACDGSFGSGAESDVDRGAVSDEEMLSAVMIFSMASSGSASCTAPDSVSSSSLRVMGTLLEFGSFMLLRTDISAICSILTAGEAGRSTT